MADLMDVGCDDDDGSMATELRNDERRLAWHRFIDEVAPLRGQLFAVALKLTGNPFDAEDLVHDGLLRAFTSTTFHYGRVTEMRAFLLRILSNLWIDEIRRSMRLRPLDEEVAALADPAGDAAETSVALRDAATTLFGRLTARERAAVVLKEACDLSHREIADLLSTSEGAVKVALHRARKRLATPPTAMRAAAPRVSRQLVDRFVRAMQDHDLPVLKAMMVDSLEAETFPSGLGVGFEAHEREGWLYGTFYHHDPRREAAGEPHPLTLEVYEIDGEPVVLVWRDPGDGAVVEEVWRLEEADGRIARVQDYCFCPDLVGHVAESFGLPWRTVGYRFRPEAYANA